MKMKKIIFGVAIAMTALFTACDKDNEAAIYSLTGQGLAFTSTNLGAIEVAPADPVYKVAIVRGNSQGSYTGHVDNVTAVLDGDTIDYRTYCTIGDYTFADGSCTAEFDVNVEKLPVGKVLTLAMECTDEANLAPTADQGTNAVTFTINKAFVWVSAGTCTFTDYTFSNSDDGDTAEGVAVEHAEETKLYRIIQPWIAVYGPLPDGFGSDSGLQFTLNDDGSIDLVPISGNIVASADQYDFCWVANYVGTYCVKAQEGNTYAFSMLGLIDGDGYYSGFAFEFTWNR